LPCPPVRRRNGVGINTVAMQEISYRAKTKLCNLGQKKAGSIELMNPAHQGRGERRATSV